MNVGPEQVLILAGSRGPSDPLARHAGLSHKALIPIDGVSMIERVVGTLHGIGSIHSIVVAIEKPELLTSLPGLQAVLTNRKLRIVPVADSPSRTVVHALEKGHVSAPFLITTADHPLLTAEMIDYFWQTLPQDIDAAVAVAASDVIRSAWPETRRTYLRFAKGAYSGCNLFAVMTTRARSVIEFWQQVESRRKRPLAMMRLLSPTAVVRFLLRRMTLDAAVEYLGGLTGSRLAAITLPFPEAAIDVDKPEDIAMAERILSVRRLSQPSG